MARSLDLSPAVPGHLQMIQGYRQGGFTIGGTRHEGPVVVLKEHTIAWSIPSFEQLSVESLEPVLAAEPAIKILVVGAGARFAMVSPDFRQAVRERGVTIECMDTPAACRTFNVLLAEDRRVAAALIPV